MEFRLITAVYYCTLAFHPTLSKKVANFDWAVVLPPHGPPVSTNLKTRLVGGRPCGGKKELKLHVSRLNSVHFTCLKKLLLVRRAA